MRVYNQNKDRILKDSEIDLDKGYLIQSQITSKIPSQKEVIEKGHYEILKEYENGGQDVAWVVDTPGKKKQEEKIEVEDIYTYIPYTNFELKEKSFNNQIANFKQELKNTDYVIIKLIESQLLGKPLKPLIAKYNEVLSKRKQLRDKINVLEEEILAIGGKIW